MAHALFSESFMRALGWALLHSVWQIALLGLALSLILSKIKPPERRYAWALGAQMLTVALFLATLVAYFLENQTSGSEVIVIYEGDDALLARNFVQNKTAEADWGLFTEWIERYHAQIVILWLTGFLFLLLRMGGSLWFLRRLRRAAEPIGEAHAYLKSILAQKGMRQVRLFVSHWISTPLTYGFFRPVVVFPTSLLNGLSPDEAEAILLHELAHIARRDWVVQLVQTLVEALFYFHPVIWWMSSVIRRERERSCDEAAIAQLSQNRILYAKSLVKVQEWAQLQASPHLALGAAGGTRRPSTFMFRIQSILLQPPQHKSMFMERTLFSGLMVAFLAYWGIQSTPVFAGSIAPITPDWLLNSLRDDATSIKSDSLEPKVKRGLTKIIKNNDGKQEIEIRMQNDQVTYLAIDGKEVPKNEYGRHQALINRTLEDAPAPPPPAPNSGDFPAPPPPPSTPDYLMPAPPPPPPAPGRMRFNGNEGTIKVDQSNAERTVIVLDREGKPTRIEVQNGKVMIDGKEVAEGDGVPLGEKKIVFFEDRDIEIVTPEGFPAPEKDMRIMEWQIEHEREIGDMHRNHERLMHEQAIEMEIQARDMHDAQLIHLAPMQHEVRVFERHGGDAFNGVLLSELKRDYLVTDEDDYSVSLNAKRLKVNGKKQPANLHQKYLALYREHTGNMLTGDKEITIKIKK